MSRSACGVRVLLLLGEKLYSWAPLSQPVSRLPWGREVSVRGECAPVMICELVAKRPSVCRHLFSLPSSFLVLFSFSPLFTLLSLSPPASLSLLLSPPSGLLVFSLPLVDQQPCTFLTGGE